MKAACLYLLVSTSLVSSDTSFLKGKAVSVGQLKAELSAAEQTIANLVHVVPGMASVLQREHPHDHKELGEGAYLDSEAVLQRTTSDNTNCEDGHWEDCYKNSGDYLDYDHPHKKPHTAQDTLNPPPPQPKAQEIKSGAAVTTVMGMGLMMAVAAIQV